MLQIPTIQDIKAARNAFEANEPRGLFYRAATELVSFALEGKTSLSVAEALAVLFRPGTRCSINISDFTTSTLLI